MKKRWIFISFASLLIFLFNTAMADDKDTYTRASYGLTKTLDPAIAYDDASTMKLYNIYERLVEFDGESTEKFKPLLATKVPTVANGGISKDGRTYTFEIRKGVKFHNGETLTAKDVEYSLERSMIVDQDGGPSWMMLDAVTGYISTREGGTVVPGIFKMIVNSVSAKGNKVTIKLPGPYPPFMSVLQFPLNSIVSKKWAVENGAWDGSLANAAKFNNPAPDAEPLRNIANGTGAYKLKNWEKSKQFVMEKFDNYWAGGASIPTVVEKYAAEWSSRKLMLQNGDVDSVDVDASYYPEIKDLTDVNFYFIPQLSVTIALMNQKIATANNPDVGSGQLDGNGIPADFFSDINVRKAFQHAFNYDSYREEIAQGMVQTPRSPNVQGMPYYKEVPQPEFELAKAEAFLKKAYGGKVWENGFKMTIAYAAGSRLREAPAQIIAENINSLNSKFQISTRKVSREEYNNDFPQGRYPIILATWSADYPDPHSLLSTFMHSLGVYGIYLGVIYKDVDALCDEGFLSADPEARKKIYQKLQDIWAERALGIGIFQPVAVKAYRKNISGFAPNPMFNTTHDLLKTLKKN